MLINNAGPTLAQLRAFLAVAEFLHFRAAAAALGVSQPTLSAALAACEEALGTR
ncbi:MAG TPA: LysR family transcriptional regulator, partial [Pseudonocardiaceae bacterium]